MRGAVLGPVAWATFRARLRARRRWVLGLPPAVLAAVAVLAGVSHESMPVAGPLALLAATLLFLVLVGGWLGDELASGAALFWVQTPHAPAILFGARFAVVAGTAGLLALTLPAATAGLLAALGHLEAAGQIARSVPALGLNLTVLAALVWGTGAWGVRGDAWAGPLVGGLLVALELVVRLQPGWLGPLAGPADLVGLPVDDLASTAALLSGNGGDLGPALRVLPWLATWGVLGTVGVHTTAGRAALAERAG